MAWWWWWCCAYACGCAKPDYDEYSSAVSSAGEGEGEGEGEVDSDEDMWNKLANHNAKYGTLQKIAEEGELV